MLPKNLSFEHGDAKLASCPGRHLTSLRPCLGGLSLQSLPVATGLDMKPRSTHVQSRGSHGSRIELVGKVHDVAEQFHCSLHVKELKVTTTELEGQTGD